MTLKGQIKVIFNKLAVFHERACYYLNVSEAHRKEVIYDLSVYLKICELVWPLKVKSRSHNFKCNISMSICPIALKFEARIYHWLDKHFPYPPILWKCNMFMINCPIALQFLHLNRRIPM